MCLHLVVNNVMVFEICDSQLKKFQIKPQKSQKIHMQKQHKKLCQNRYTNLKQLNKHGQNFIIKDCINSNDSNFFYIFFLKYFQKYKPQHFFSMYPYKLLLIQKINQQQIVFSTFQFYKSYQQLLMKLVLLLLLFLLPIIFTITLQQLNLQQIDPNNLNVEVQGDSSNVPENDTWIKKYFLVKSIGKHKKTTYENLITKLKRISIHLKKKLIIPSEQFLIGTRISSKYLVKKQYWCFSQIILIYAKEEDAEGVEATFKSSQIEGIDTYANLEQFKQKFQVIRAFYDAKIKILSKIKTKKSLEVDDVISIEILTPNIDKEINQFEFIEDIEDSSDEEQERQQKKSKQNQTNAKTKNIKNIQIKVTFQLDLDWQLDNDEKQIIFSTETNLEGQNDL